MSRVEVALVSIDDGRPALDDGTMRLNYRALREAVARERAWLAATGLTRFALLADNGIGWVIADLALYFERLINVPVPACFTDAQLLHVLDDADVEALLTCNPARAQALLPHWFDAGTVGPAGLALRLRPRDAITASPVPLGTLKVTYTSGSTGTPKGVCLGAAQIETVVQSLVDATRSLGIRRHLAILPLPTLLENLAGVYVPLATGATCVVPPASTTGMDYGRLDAGRLLGCIATAKPESLILVPELLDLIVAAAEKSWPVPASLQFVAVGGGSVARELFARAAAVGLPVYEGYGLSEGASVVCLNTPEAHRPGTVGRPLPHARLRIDKRGEVMIRGATMFGYLGGAPRDPDAELATGDLGELDDDGYLHLRGRLRNLYITSLGRNVSPEWVEREIVSEPGIRQVLVHGEARPHAVALIVPESADTTPDVIERAISNANRRLPDYARVCRWTCVPEPFGVSEGFATANGRLRRDAIVSRYAALLQAMYDGQQLSNERLSA